MEYIGEVLSRADFERRVKKYSNSGVKHFYFMGLGSDEVKIFIFLFSFPSPF